MFNPLFNSDNYWYSCVVCRAQHVCVSANVTGLEKPKNTRTTNSVMSFLISPKFIKSLSNWGLAGVRDWFWGELMVSQRSFSLGLFQLSSMVMHSSLRDRIAWRFCFEKMHHFLMNLRSPVSRKWSFEWICRLVSWEPNPCNKVYPKSQNGRFPIAWKC